VEESKELEVHLPLSAGERDRFSPVWDMSQERAFLETILNQRFNFTLIFFSLVLAGALNARSQIIMQLILSLGAVATALFASVIARAQEKLDIALRDLTTDPTHPVSIVESRAKKGGSRRRLIGIHIPRLCVAALGVAAISAWVGWLQARPCP
jgi:hypothetical protein